MDIARSSPQRSRYLLAINKGSSPVRIKREGVNWDLMDIYFRPEDLATFQANPSFTDAEYVVFETNKERRKFAIVKSLWESGDILSRYDAILLADDDVSPVGCTIKEIFDLFMKTGARIGQPALTQNSHYAHFLTVQNKNFVWRRVNHVDFMCIIMTPDAISDYHHVMDQTVSGFGLNHYWGSKEWQRGTAHCVLDATPMYHSRPIGSGEAYHGLDPMREYANFMKFHNIEPYPHRTLDGSPARMISPSDAYWLALLFAGYDEKFFELTSQPTKDASLFAHFLDEIRTLTIQGSRPNFEARAAPVRPTVFSCFPKYIINFYSKLSKR